MLKKIFGKHFFFVLGAVSVLLAGMSWWGEKIFGKVHILQVLWHFENAFVLTEFDTEYIYHIFQWLSVCLVFVCMLFVLLYKRNTLYAVMKKKKAFSFLVSRKTDIVLNSFIFLFSCFLLYSIYGKYSIYDLITLQKQEYHEENDFFLHNYKVPPFDEIVFKQKNNLVIVLLEGMEKNPCLTNDVQKLMPFFEKMKKADNTLSQLVNCHGTKWTIAALTAWHYGLPLKLPKYVDKNQYIAEDFLPHAVNIFEIFAKNTYSCSLVMGTSSVFSAINVLFRRGNFKIYDLLYYNEVLKNDPIAQASKTSWGYSDRFTFEKALEEYQKLQEAGNPFVLFVQTIDTHSPKGVVAKKNRVYGDIRDAWVQMNNDMEYFMEKLYPMLDDRTNLLIIGDHRFFLCDVKHNHNLYNVFSGKKMPAIPESKLNQKINPMDMAPTILHAAGARWNDNQFGLGFSIFSEDKSFSERLGIEELDGQLMPYSKFYDSFF